MKLIQYIFCYSQKLLSSYTNMKWIIETLDCRLSSAVKVLDVGPLWKNLNLPNCIKDNLQVGNMHSCTNLWEVSIVCVLVAALLQVITILKKSKMRQINPCLGRSSRRNDRSYSTLQSTGNRNLFAPFSQRCHRFNCGSIPRAGQRHNYLFLYQI